MTIIKMFSTVGDFFIVTIYYLLLMALIFYAMFSDFISDYYDIVECLRIMFDAFMGTYYHHLLEDPTMDVLYVVILYLHVYVANIFLLNYLVAILATVYGEEQEIGIFSWNTKLYSFIERYRVAFLDENGYCELVMLSPPMNFLLVFLLPFTFDNEVMKPAQLRFSLFIFWLENTVYYIPKQLLNELVLLPWNYFRTGFNIIIKAGSEGFYQFPLWVLCGPFFLLGYVFVDMYYFIHMLSAYKIDHGREEKLKLHDEKQDRVVLYNEIHDVLKCVYFIFLQRHNECISEKGKLTSVRGELDLATAIKQQEEIFGIDDVAAYDDEDTIIEGFLIDWHYILHAWARFRPPIEKPEGSQESCEKFDKSMQQSSADKFKLPSNEDKGSKGSIRASQRS